MRYLVNGEEVELEPSNAMVSPLPDRLMVRTGEGTASALAVRQGDSIHVSYKGRTFVAERASGQRTKRGAKASGTIQAPMPGQIVDVNVEEGSQVTLGQKLLVLEAMKMQHAVGAPFDGRVKQLPVRKGDQVVEGQLLVSVEPEHE